MDKAIYKRYAEIKGQMKALSEEMEILKEDILVNMEKKSESFEFGRFTRGINKTYKFSEKVKKIEERLEIARFKEKERGIAQVIESPKLTFTPPKMD